MINVAVSSNVIDAGDELRAMESAGAGAIASFSGLVRTDDGVQALELEHYPEATEAALRAIAAEAVARWKLLAVRIVHRVGRMAPSDTVVFVGTSAPHRHAALEACAYVIDRLKTDAPFWKKETLADGARWVNPRGSDDAASARWKL